MNNSKVSVIIPTYNEEKNIAACLESILAQNYPNFEVIMVDDGSVDKTVEIINKFPVKLVKGAHVGPGKARNKGAAESEGSILVFVDADMTFTKNFIEELVKPLLAGEFKGTFSKQELVGNWDNIWARCWNFNKNINSPRMIPEDYPDQGIDFRAILKSEFIKISGFDDTGYTDTWTLHQKLGFRPNSVTGATYYHNNPDSLVEVFIQARWVSKRSYKFGVIGLLVTLARYSPPISLINGVIGATKFIEWRFLIFKLVYDFGSLIGIFQMMIMGKLSK